MPYPTGATACDQKLIQYLGDLEPKVDVVESRWLNLGPSCKRRTKRTGDYRLMHASKPTGFYGVDVTRIPGLDGMALLLFSELRSNLAIKFPNSDEFSSWLGLCPDNDKTGGKVVWRGVRNSKNRAGQMYRQAASALHRSRSPLGDLLRRMKAKMGPEAALLLRLTRSPSSFIRW